MHTICVCSLPIHPRRLGLLAWGMGPAVTMSTLNKYFVHVLLASSLERYPGFQGHRVILRLVPKKNSSEKPCLELPNLLSPTEVCLSMHHLHTVTSKARRPSRPLEMESTDGYELPWACGELNQVHERVAGPLNTKPSLPPLILLLFFFFIFRKEIAH